MNLFLLLLYKPWVIGLIPCIFSQTFIKSGTFTITQDKTPTQNWGIEGAGTPNLLLLLLASQVIKKLIYLFICTYSIYSMSLSEGFGFEPRRNHLPYGTSGGSLCSLQQHTQISPLWDEPHLSSTYNYYTKHSLYISPLVGVPTGEFNDTWLLQYLQKPSVTQSNLNETETEKISQENFSYRPLCGSTTLYLFNFMTSFRGHIWGRTKNIKTCQGKISQSFVWD